MPATTTPRTPEGKLIRRVREAAGLTIPDAARLAGISDSQWGNVERGVRTEGGSRVEIDGQAPTVAAMAAALRITPERLETEGERPDAADALREILRRRSPAPSPELRAVPAPPDRDAADDAAQILADLVERYPDDTVIAAIAAQGGKAARIRVAEVLEWLEVSGARRDNGTAG